MPKPPESTGQAVDGLLQQFMTAWNGGDALKMSCCWTARGTLINTAGILATGRDSIKVLLDNEHAAGLRGSTAEIASANTHSLGADYLLLDMMMRVTLADSSVKHMSVNIVLKKEEGGWYYHHARPHLTSPPPEHLHSFS